MTTPAGNWDVVYDPLNGNTPDDEGWLVHGASMVSPLGFVSGGQYVYQPDLSGFDGPWESFDNIRVRAGDLEPPIGPPLGGYGLSAYQPVASTWRYTFEDDPADSAWPTWHMTVDVPVDDGLWSAFVFGSYDSGLGAWRLLDLPSGEVLATVASPRGTHEVILVTDIRPAAGWTVGSVGWGGAVSGTYRLVFDGVDYFHEMNHIAAGDHAADFLPGGQLVTPAPIFSDPPDVGVTWRIDYFAVSDSTDIGV